MKRMQRWYVLAKGAKRAAAHIANMGKAQDEATRRKTLTDQGIDPRQQRKAITASAETARRKAQQKTLTFGEAWQHYIEARKAKWGGQLLRKHLYMSQPGGLVRKRGRRTGQSITRCARSTCCICGTPRLKRGADASGHRVRAATAGLAGDDYGVTAKVIGPLLGAENRAVHRKPISGNSACACMAHVALTDCLV